MENLNFVKLKNNLKHLDLEKQIIEAIDQKIKRLPNYAELKHNPELVLLVCNLLENSIDNRKSKIKVDKKLLVLKVLTATFNYNEQDKKQIDQTIEFLHSNKRIKKVSTFRKISSMVWEWLKKKLL